MLTTIPFEMFMSLENGSLSEAKENFNFNKFKKLPVQKMKGYLENDCNIPVAGVGSSREVYLMSKNDASFLKGPACLKLGRVGGNMGVGAGIGQNKEEASILGKYQDNYECFPLLYYRDGNNYFIVVELGTPLSSAPRGLVSTQLSPLKETIEEFIEDNDYPSTSIKFKFSKLMNNVQDKTNFATLLTLFTTFMTDSRFYHSRNYNKAELEWFNEFVFAVKDASGDDAVIKSLYDTINFASRKVARSIMFEDFIQPENWAFVNRFGEFSLIPIDWGFTKNVAKNYYGYYSKNSSSDFDSDEDW